MRIFLSYSAQDQALADRFATLLKRTLGSDAVIFRDRPHLDAVDRWVEPGAWLERIASEFQSADVVLGLVTRNFLNSGWFHAEMGGAILAGKEVIPVCVAPVTKNALPTPVTSRQAYGMNPRDLGALIRHLSPRSRDADLSADLDELVSASTSQDTGGDAAAAVAILGSVEADRTVESLVSIRRAAGAFLTRLHAGYAGFVDAEADVRCDADGNCTIQRTEVIEVVRPVAHVYYDVNVDRPGRIEMVRAEIAGASAPPDVVTHLHTDIRRHYSILFDRMYLPGERVTIATEVIAEGYLGDVIDKGIGQVFYRRVGSLQTRRHALRFRFPANAAIFARLRAYVSESVDRSKVGREIPGVRVGDERGFDVELLSPDGGAGVDILEFRR